MGFREVELSEVPFRDCESVVRTSPFPLLEGNGLQLLMLSLMETHYQFNSGLTRQIWEVKSRLWDSLCTRKLHSPNWRTNKWVVGLTKPGFPYFESSASFRVSTAKPTASSPRLLRLPWLPNAQNRVTGVLGNYRVGFGGWGVQVGQHGDGKKQIVEAGLWPGNLPGTTGVDLFFFYRPLMWNFLDCSSIASR